MAKITSEPKIEFIVKELRTGKIKTEIFAAFGAFWQVGQRTFDRLFIEASKRFTEAQQAIEQARHDQLTEAAKNELNEAIITEMECDAIVSQIATGNCKVQEWVKGEAILRDVNPTEVLNAIDKLYKRKGSYAPIKQAATKTDGTDVPTTPITINVTADKLVQFPDNAEDTESL